MSKATLKVSIKGQQIVCLDILMLLNLIGYRGGPLLRSLLNVDFEKCDFELEVITHNGVEELKAIYALDPPPVYTD